MYSQKWNCSASFSFPTFMYLWMIYIFPGSKYPERSWKNINRSQLHDYGNWETEHYNSVFERTRLRCFISGNTYIGTRHLYWILAGPSYKRNSKISRGFSRYLCTWWCPGRGGWERGVPRAARAQSEGKCRVLTWETAPDMRGLRRHSRRLKWKNKEMRFFNVANGFKTADETTFAAPNETFKLLKSFLRMKFFLATKIDFWNFFKMK